MARLFFLQLHFGFKVAAFEKNLVETIVAERALKRLLRLDIFIVFQLNPAPLAAVDGLLLFDAQRFLDHFDREPGITVVVFRLNRADGHVPQIRKRAFGLRTMRLQRPHGVLPHLRLCVPEHRNESGDSPLCIGQPRQLPNGRRRQPAHIGHRRTGQLNEFRESCRIARIPERHGSFPLHSFKLRIHPSSP